MAVLEGAASGRLLERVGRSRRNASWDCYPAGDPKLRRIYADLGEFLYNSSIPGFDANIYRLHGFKRFPVPPLSAKPLDSGAQTSVIRITQKAPYKADPACRRWRSAQDYTNQARYERHDKSLVGDYVVFSS